mgnify:CR=1 FL=1
MKKNLEKKAGLFLMIMFPALVMLFFGLSIWGIYLIIPYLQGEITIGVILFGLLALWLASIVIKNGFKILGYVIVLITLAGFWLFDKKKR